MINVIFVSLAQNDRNIMIIVMRQNMTQGFYTAKHCPNCGELFNVSGLTQSEKRCPAGCGALLMITPVRVEYVIREV